MQNDQHRSPLPSIQSEKTKTVFRRTFDEKTFSILKKNKKSNGENDPSAQRSSRPIEKKFDSTKTDRFVPLVHRSVREEPTPNVPMLKPIFNRNSTKMFLGEKAARDEQILDEQYEKEKRFRQSKSKTPLFNHQSVEQIRARINRSVTDRLNSPKNNDLHRRGILQQVFPFDASPSKQNNLRQRNQNRPLTIFHTGSHNFLSFRLDETFFSSEIKIDDSTSHNSNKKLSSTRNSEESLSKMKPDGSIPSITVTNRQNGFAFQTSTFSRIPPDFTCIRTEFMSNK